MQNTWKVLSTHVNRKQKNWLLNLLLKNRGLTEKIKAEEFLYPKFGHILQVKLTDVDKATNRIKTALQKSEKIIVYSDYDADGICATAIAWETLNDLGAKVLPYIPHRIKEGYGLSNDAIKKLAIDGVKLIVTVDHGVTAVNQVESAKKLGIDVIITDHHVLPQITPKAYALVHTTNLCGAGVAWRFMWEVIKKLKPSYQEILLEKLELAALATIADLVPLLGANRAIVKFGLEKISKTKRFGIKALIKSSGIVSKIGTYEIGHILAPRINAMGRIEHGLDSLRLLCSKNQKQAEDLSQILTKTNTKRQDLTSKALEQAKSLVVEENLVGVIAHDSLHEGVIGLVASRLVEAHHRPMIVISKGEIYSKGSARSISGFNIVEAIRFSSEYVVDGGGHPMAAGFTIETRHIEAFSKKINSYALSRLTDDLLNPTLTIECELQVGDLTKMTFKTIEKLEPFGASNPQPLFVTKKMLVEDIRRVGIDNKHLKLQLSGISTIAFNFGQMLAEIRPGFLVDVVYSLAEDRYSGADSLQLKVKDLKVANS